MISRSVAQIAAGEQLTLCYGPQVGEMPAAVRRQQLWQQYGFCCSCSDCVQPDAAREAMAGGVACGRAGCTGV